MTGRRGPTAGLAARWALALVAAAPGASLTAQGIAWTTASPPVAATLAAVLAEAAPAGWRLERRGVQEVWDGLDRGEGLDCDLLLAVDVELAAHAGRGRALERRSWELPPGVLPLHRDPADRYLVPWAMPWRAVWDDRKVDDRDAPRSLADFGRPRFRQAVVLPDPRSAPGWFVGWVQDGERQGGIGLSFRALLDVDRSTRRWLADPAEALLELRADPQVLATCVPLALVRELDPRAPFRSADLQPYALAQGLAVAAVQGGRDLPPTAWARLLAPATALRLMREHGVLPGLRADAADGEQLPPELLTTLADLAPLDPGRPEVADWLRRFDEEVRGAAGGRDDLRLVIELVFLLAGISLIVWIRRKAQSAEA